MREHMAGDGVDLVKFSWVDPYLKGIKYQEEIKALQGEIEGIRRSPRAKAEILTELKLMADRVEAVRVAGVRDVVRRFQDGELAALTPEAFAQIFIAPSVSVVSRSHTGAHAFEALLTDKIIAAAMQELPEGLTVAEKEAKIAALQEKIKKLQEKLEKECWPDSRKVFDDKGRPLAGQDRWQDVVDRWRKVAAPYCKPVDLAGYAIEQGSNAWEAFRKLKLGQFMTGSSNPPSRQRG